jgi:hypothetical protein
MVVATEKHNIMLYSVITEKLINYAQHIHSHEQSSNTDKQTEL